MSDVVQITVAFPDPIIAAVAISDIGPQGVAGPVGPTGPPGSVVDRVAQRGVVASDDFVRASLGPNYTHVGTLASSSVSFSSGVLSVRAISNGASGLNVTYFNAATLDSDQWEVTVRWRQPSSSNGFGGPGFGWYGRTNLSSGGPGPSWLAATNYESGRIQVGPADLGNARWLNTTAATNPNWAYGDVMVTKLTMRGPLLTVATWNDTALSTNNAQASAARTAEVVDFSALASGNYTAAIAGFCIYHRHTDFDILSWEIRDLSPKAPDVLVIGDSISRGYDSLNSSWVDNLRAKGLAVSVIGGPGCGIADYALLAAEAAGFTPKKIVVALGTNDVSDGTALATIQSRFASMQSALSPMGVPVFWMAPTFAGGTDRNPLRLWITANLSPFIDPYPYFANNTGLTASNLLPAGLHPNANGHKLLASVVHDKISR